jgi:hypothetical protein
VSFGPSADMDPIEPKSRVCAWPPSFGSARFFRN